MSVEIEPGGSSVAAVDGLHLQTVVRNLLANAAKYTTEGSIRAVVGTTDPDVVSVSVVDTGIGTLLADWAKDANISVLLLAWVLAVLIRLATGSATVATITASSLMIGLVEGMSTGETSLVVLAVGAGSVFFSHVNDAGFWLVNQMFRLTVGQTFKTWSAMETLVSLVAFGFTSLIWSLT